MKRLSPFSVFGLGLMIISFGHAFGQVSVDVPGVSVNVGKGKGSNAAVSIGPGSSASNSSGTIDADVEMEGIAIINDDVFIDGEKIQRGKTRHVSKKSGKSYRIQWGKNGNISVDQN